MFKMLSLLVTVSNSELAVGHRFGHAVVYTFTL